MQGSSGLGLEAQQEAIRGFLNGGSWELLEEFTEVESGKGSNALERRPVLREAIAYAKKHKAKLLIAKLDRLARNVRFITELMESKVPFVAADMPDANELTIHIMAAMAQHERKMISERTKAALKAAKQRGVKLGNPNLKNDNDKKRVVANEFAKRLKPTINAYLKAGLSQRMIVDELNRLATPTPRGGSWSLVQLQRVIKRISQME